MFSSLRNRFGAPWLIAVVALVLAMAGGALAASGALTPKQKKEVEKIAKKFAGAPGAQGAPGTNGANGKDGVQGSQGEKGSPGTNGTNGKSVLTGAATVGECANGGATVETEGEPATKKPVCNGTNGTNGANATFEYLFNTATSGDPTSGKLGLNNAAPGSATAVRLSETDHEATGIAAAIATWVSGPGAKGSLMIRKVSSQSTYALYTIAGNKDEGAFDSLEVAFVSGHGSFANNDPVTVQYYASATSTLPSGATETGVYELSNESGTGPVFETYEQASISFTIPLAAGLPENHGRVEGQPEFALHCPGNAESPKAEPGYLCVYQAIVEGMTINEVLAPGFNTGTSAVGAVVTYIPEAANAYAQGTWAVTAP